VGAGGHAKVIVELLEQANEMQIVGCTTAQFGQSDVLGYPILGSDDVLPALFQSGVDYAFPAVGDNRTRRSRSLHLQELGFRIPNAISGRAIISNRVALGSGVAVMAGAVINVNAVIGDGSIVNTGATIDHDCSIGAYVHVAPGCSLAGRVRVKEGAFLGLGTKVIPGISIGSWAHAYAGAVIVSDIPDGESALGVPAKLRRLA
jgi:UDP-perosamine 4-acetyltransferase